MRLLFEGVVYFYGKPADIDGLIRYVQVRWWQLLDTVSSTHSLSVLNDSYNTNSLGASVLTVVRNYSHTCAHAESTIWRWCLFRSELPIVQLLFEGGVYFVQSFRLCGYCSRVVFISFRASNCAATIWGRLLFEGVKEIRYIITCDWCNVSNRKDGRKHVKHVGTLAQILSNIPHASS